MPEVEAGIRMEEQYLLILDGNLGIRGGDL